MSGKIQDGVLTLIPPFVLFANRYEITANVQVAEKAVAVDSSMVKTFDSTQRRQRSITFESTDLSFLPTVFYP